MTFVSLAQEKLCNITLSPVHFFSKKEAKRDIAQFVLCDIILPMERRLNQSFSKANVTLSGEQFWGKDKAG
jgi:hypothetical protein